MLLKNRALWAFLAAGVFLWCRDLKWLNAASETLPILLAFPIAIYLGRPWNIDLSKPGNRNLMFAGAVLATLGFMADTCFVLSCAWVCCFLGWLLPKVKVERRKVYIRLAPILLLAFPWLLIEGETIGWYFRISGAWANEILFSVLGLEVLREGTQLSVAGWAIDVEPACSGLRSLQVMLLAGCAIAFDALRNSRLYWIHVPIIVGLAWLGNSCRIALITALAITYSPEVAEGIFHDVGGLVVIGIMIVLCDVIFRRISRAVPPREAATC